jgi:ATP-dependent DNA ligase
VPSKKSHLDVLYLNGKPLTEETLEKRVGILQNEILSSEDKGIVHISPKTTIAKA